MSSAAAGAPSSMSACPGLVRDWKLDLVVVNGENAAGGFGITEAIYRELVDAGADAVTLGNHAWDQKEALVFIERAPRLIRPINYPAGTPGRGAAMIEAKNGARALVVNAMGRIFMDPLDDPFAAVERELAACPLRNGADAIIIDIHGEATSEKQAMGHFCDGRASLVVGTHTHAPDSGSARPAGRHRLHERCRHDRRLRFGDRHGQGRAAAALHARISSSRFEPASGPATLVRRRGRNRSRRPGLRDARRRGAARRLPRTGAAGILGPEFGAYRRQLYFSRSLPSYKARPTNQSRLPATRSDARCAYEDRKRSMAGHSQFKNIMHRKGRQDAAKSKLFGKLAREITVSAKLGMPDPTMNPRLRAAIIAARAENMPKDNIDRAIKKAPAMTARATSEIRYEGYGPGGVAVIVEVLTDNRNRTAGEVRAAFTKSGGNLAETGAVSFMFDHVGVIEYDAKAASADAMFEAALEAGADDVVSSDNGHEIYAAQDRFGSVAKALEAKFGEPRTRRRWYGGRRMPLPSV